MLNIGHRHPKVVEAVKAQLDKLMHTCQTVMPYEGYVKLAQKLSEVVPVKGHGKAAPYQTSFGPMAAFELVESKDTHKPMPELAGAIPHNEPCTVSEGLPPPTLFTSFNVTKKHTLLSSTPLLSALRMCWLIINHCML